MSDSRKLTRQELYRHICKATALAFKKRLAGDTRDIRELLTESVKEIPLEWLQ